MRNSYALSIRSLSTVIALSVVICNKEIEKYTCLCTFVLMAAKRSSRFLIPNAEVPSFFKNLLESPNDPNLYEDKEIFNQDPHEWLIQASQDWINSSSEEQKLLCVALQPGMGNEVFSSSLSRVLQQSNQLVAFCRCIKNDCNRSTGSYIIRYLAYQIGVQFHGSREFIVAESESIQSKLHQLKLCDMYESFIVIPLEKGGSNADSAPYMAIIIDAVENIGLPGSRERAEWLVVLESIALLPSWVKVVVTYTSGAYSDEISQALSGAHCTRLVIEPNDPRYIEGLNIYATKRLQKWLHSDTFEQSESIEAKIESFKETLVKRSEGSFVYTSLAIDLIQELGKQVSTDAVEKSLTTGLTLFLGDQLKKVRDFDTKLFNKVTRSLINLLVAARAPLSISEALSVLKCKLESFEKAAQSLSFLFPLFGATNQDSGAIDSLARYFRPRHPDIINWLVGTQIAQELRADVAKGNEYFSIEYSKQLPGLGSDSPAEWFMPPKGSYLYYGLLDHFDAVGRTNDSRALLFRLPWLMQAMTERGVESTLRDLRSRTTPSSKDKEFILLAHVLHLCAPVLKDNGKMHADRLPLQLLGRLRSFVDVNGSLVKKPSGILSRMMLRLSVSSRLSNRSISMSSGQTSPGAQVSGTVFASNYPFLQLLYNESKMWWKTHRAYYPLRLSLPAPGGDLITTIELPSFVFCIVLIREGVYACGCEDGNIYVLSEDSQRPDKTLVGHKASVRSLTSVGKKYLVSVSDDKSVRIWDNTFECLHTLQGHNEDVYTVISMGEGKTQAVSGSMDKDLRVWDCQSGICIKQLQGHTGWVMCLALLPNGLIVSGSADYEIRIWDILQGCKRVLSGHKESVLAVAVTQDSKIISGSRDTTVRIWDSVTGSCLKELAGHAEGVATVTIISGGNIVSGSYDKTLRLWHPVSGQCLKEMKGHTEDVSCLLAIGDGKIISGSADKTVRFWNTAVGDGTSVAGFAARILTVAVFPDGRVVSGSNDSTLRVWDKDTGDCQRVMTGHMWDVLTVTVFQDDSSRCVSGGTDKIGRIWNAATGELLKKLTGHTHSIRCLVTLPDEKVVSGSDDKSIRIWEASSGLCIKKLLDHTQKVRTLALLSSGYVVSGSEDYSLRVWDTTEGKCLHKLMGSSEVDIKCVAAITAIEPLDGNKFVAVCADRTIRMWDVDEGTELRLPDGDAMNMLRRVYEQSIPACAEVFEYGIPQVMSLTAGAEGRLAMGTEDGSVYIFTPNQTLRET